MVYRVYLLSVVWAGVSWNSLCMHEDSEPQAHKEFQHNSLTLHDMCKVGDIEKAQQLISLGAEIDMRDEHQATPLHRAVSFHHIHVAHLLLEHGASVMSQDKHGDTPLHRAASWCEPAIVKLLLDYGASVEIKNDEGETPIHRAALSNVDLFKTLVLYPHTIPDFWHDPDTMIKYTGPSLKATCLTFIALRKLERERIQKLPDDLKQALEQQRTLTYIRSLPLRKNKRGTTPFDLTAIFYNDDVLGFIHNLRKARTFDDLKVLGYQG